VHSAGGGEASYRSPAGTTAYRLNRPLPRRIDPPPPAVIARDWVVHEVSGESIVLSAPPSFAPSGRGGCFEGHTQDSVPYAPGWRRFCVGLHPAGEPIPVWVDGLERGCSSDCVELDRVLTTQTTLGQQDVIVQTAWVSGGLAGKPRAPEMLVQIPVRVGLVILRGEYGDASDAAVLLGIAQTISVVGSP